MPVAELADFLDHLHAAFAAVVEAADGPRPSTNSDDVDTAVLRGTIVDADGHPLPEARIYVRGVAVEGTSAPDGTFELVTPLRPDHVLTFLRDGWKRCEVPLVADVPERFYRVTLTPR